MAVPAPGSSGQQLPIRRWIGGFLLLLASIWLFLLIRDFYVSVLARDATATHANTFWRLGTLISAIAILFGVAVGLYVFRPDRSPDLKPRTHRHRRHHPSGVAVPNAAPIEPTNLESDSIDTPIDSEVDPASNSESVQLGDRTPKRVKIRVKRRIRERIRKKET